MFATVEDFELPNSVTKSATVRSSALECLDPLKFSTLHIIALYCVLAADVAWRRDVNKMMLAACLDCVLSCGACDVGEICHSEVLFVQWRSVQD